MPVWMGVGVAMPFVGVAVVAVPVAADLEVSTAHLRTYFHPESLITCKTLANKDTSARKIWVP